ncbi:hypothetical protein KQX54_012654 [Cotesia glomerata]|uniref:Uncharacterized protein n=1 Tax=Cotesia glomerata TaxID=32391 RepID=A0AAV7HWB8_COTGL|nr:hypothetical protein KQX54_012654 [Cotesia glomerata]
MCVKSALNKKLSNDNKLLALPNEERLSLPPNVRVTFKVQNFKYVTITNMLPEYAATLRVLASRNDESGSRNLRGDPSASQPVYWKIGAEDPGQFRGDEYTILMTQCKKGPKRKGLMLNSNENYLNYYAVQLLCPQLVRKMVRKRAVSASSQIPNPQNHNYADFPDLDTTELKNRENEVGDVKTINGLDKK